MATIHQWPHQLYIKFAFLHDELEKRVYMAQPPYFTVHGSSGLVCHLHCSLYGSKQSPRAWFRRFRNAIKQFDMIHYEADHYVFFCHSSPSCIYLVVYVDNIVITSNDEADIQLLQ